MEASAKAFELIKKYGDLRLIAYKPVPTDDFFTIGYGHTDESIKIGQRISLQKAEEILKEDVASIEQKLADNYPNLKQHEFDALVSFIYNVGWNNFRYNLIGVLCKYIRKVHSPLSVAMNMILWVEERGKEPFALKKRRLEEANLFMGGKNFILFNGEIIKA